jgi:Protein kinase C terminal domain
MQQLNTIMFTYSQKNASDVGNFDSEFTREPARLTNIGRHLLNTIDQTLFDGFSFTNALPPPVRMPLSTMQHSKRR